MEEQNFEKVIAFLEHVRNRPTMYFNEDSTAIDNFIAGFTCACGLFLDYSDIVVELEYIMREEGWSSSNNLTKKMLDEGLSLDDIADQQLAMMIKAFKRYVDSH